MESPTTQRIKVMFTHKMEERKIYMEELHEMRMQNYRDQYKKIKRTIGPSWYQVLSIKQQKALLTIPMCIYQDLLEGRPVRTNKLLICLGLHPIPNKMDLMTCMFLGRDDPKQFLAQLFFFIFDHDFSQSRNFPYPLNGRLILSSIYYLGLQNLIEMLKEKFKPDTIIPRTPSKVKHLPRNKNLSPYLQDFQLKVYEPPKPKRRIPAPLPNLDHLNEPCEEEPPLPRPPPPPPPPPPPKKRLPVSYCDKIAGYIRVGPPITKIAEPPPPKPISRRLRASKMCLTDTKKKTYGLGAAVVGKQKKQKKPRLVEIANMPNNSYLISGVYFYGQKTFYIIGGICVMPTKGDPIHGGHKLLNGEYVRIHLGIKGLLPPPESDPCDCMAKWYEKAADYLEKTKCRCGHYYDFGHDGRYPLDAPMLYEKPGPRGAGYFDYNNVYELEPRVFHVQSEYQKIWDEESVLQDEDEDEEVKKKKKSRRRELNPPVHDCLGENPKIEDYLRCALRLIRRVNIAAKLPDIHLAPELREWMRKRIYGDYTPEEKRKIFKRSRDYWVYLDAFQKMGLGKTWPEKTTEYQQFRDTSTWRYKSSLQKKFKTYMQDYKVKIFRAHALYNNMLWATMFQPKFPDKRFREIFFCYVVSKLSDLTLMHPYNPMETEKRRREMSERRFVCLAAGVEDLDRGG